MLSDGLCVTRVAVSAIDTADTTFRISSTLPAPSLKASIRRIGLQNPPHLVIRGERENRQIVCGFRRIAAMAELGCRDVPVILLPAGTPTLECARLAIVQNTFGRELNPMECFRAYRLLRDLTGAPEKVALEAGHLGLPSHADYINRCLQIEKMPRPLQRCLRDGDISLPMALRIVRLPSESQLAIVALFERFRPGFNQQKELLALIDDIVRRDDCRLADWIESLLAESSPEQRGLSGPQGLKWLLGRLRSVRYPSIAAADRRFQEAVERLQAGRGVRIKAPGNRELPSRLLQIEFTSRRELQRRSEQVSRLIDHPALDDLFP
jgi:hypothetical protein